LLVIHHTCTFTFQCTHSQEIFNFGNNFGDTFCCHPSALGLSKTLTLLVPLLNITCTSPPSTVPKPCHPPPTTVMTRQGGGRTGATPFICRRSQSVGDSLAVPAEARWQRSGVGSRDNDSNKNEGGGGADGGGDSAATAEVRWRRRRRRRRP
jgi:hypothetical protein